MKILLLNPPSQNKKAFIREGRCNQEQGVWSTQWPPITLATAGAILENNGHEIQIMDCAALGTGFNELFEIIRENNFSLIAWATATPSITSDLALADNMKKIDSDIKTAVFGTHVTALAEACLKMSKGLDFIVRNEPEESLSELAKCLETHGDLNHIEGISYQNGDNEIFHNSQRQFNQNLDNLPFPAWHLLDLEQYKLPLIGKKFVILSPVRGCPYSCTFCTAKTYYGGKLRKRSPQKMIDEIKYNIERFGINHFFIWADTFTADNDYVRQFCKSICDNNLKISWTCNSRVDTVNFELLKIMAEAGCWMISYGIESSSQRILDKAKKKITIDQANIAVKAATKSGIKVAAHFILGLPGENKKTIKETITFASKSYCFMAQFYCAVPFPGSPLYETALKKDWISNVTFETFSQDNAIMNLPDISAAEVNKFRRKAYLKFYSRPSRLFHIINMMSINNLFEIIKSSFRFIRWMVLK